MPSNGPSDISASHSPYIQKEEDSKGGALQQTIKSYKNEDFLLSHDGRLIRIICEFEEPKQRMKRNCIRSTLLFFGSARSMTKEQYRRTKAGLEERLKAAADDAATQMIQGEIDRLEKTEWMCEWMDGAERLARLIAEFARDETALISRTFDLMPDFFHMDMGREAGLSPAGDFRGRCHDFVVTTGGGPGFMEAANRGARSVPGTKTIGMGISLPFEKGLNQYVSEDLSFEFHYFFTRKFWMMYSCRAIVVAPGGFGTLDETFELLTLRQTKKVPNLPVVLFGKEFWTTVVNWQALTKYGVVSQEDINSLCFTDSPEEALAFIKAFYVEIEANSPRKQGQQN